MVDLSFVNQFGYPKEVKVHFQTIVDHLDFEKTLSLLLHGSTSRGELTWSRDEQGVLHLYSDYEFQIVVRNRRDAVSEYQRLRPIYLQLERDFSQSSPLFHIDFSVVPQAKIRHLARYFITFEKKNAGIIAYGKDVRDQIPSISIDNLDFQELNEILIWRLWALLLYFPVNWLTSSQLSKNDPFLFSYLCCRNALDLTTFLLPYEGKLLCGFMQRVRYIVDHYDEMGFSTLMGDEFPAFLEGCLEGKLRLRFPMALELLHSRTLDYFEIAISYLLTKNGRAEESIALQSHELWKATSGLFTDYTLKRKYYETSQILQFWNNDASFSVAETFKWFFRPKMSVVLEFLLVMHKAIRGILIHDNSPSAEKHIVRAQELLNKLSRVQASSRDENLITRWLQLRESFIDFFVQFIPGLRSKSQHLQKFLLYRGAK